MSTEYNPYLFHLVGKLEGSTINLGGHQFIDGVYTFAGDEPHIQPSEDDAKLKAAYLAKSYQAFPQGSEALKEAQKRLAGGEAPEGELDVTKREQEDQDKAATQQVQGRQIDGAIRTAIGKLDPKNAEHWTTQGLPSVEAVRALSENADVSRADITRLAPNLTREEAAKVAADADAALK